MKPRAPGAARRRRGGARRVRGGALAAVVLVAVGCAETAPPKPPAALYRWTITGATMGTTFTVTVVSGGGPVQGPARPKAQAPADAAGPSANQRGQAGVEAEVRRLARAGRGADVPLPPRLGALAFQPGADYRAAAAVSERRWGSSPRRCRSSRASGGAFDVTVGPLVDAWGFGPPGRAPSPPDEASLAALRARVGIDLLEVDLVASTLRKTARGPGRGPVGHRQGIRSRRGGIAARRAWAPRLPGGDRRRTARGRRERARRAVARRHRAAGPRCSDGAAHRVPDGRRPRHVRRLPQLLRAATAPGRPTPSIRAPAAR